MWIQTDIYSGPFVPYRRLQEIEKLPKRDQEALLRTIDAFVTKAG